METRVHERNHQQVPHNTVEGEEEHHNEKKSVFTKAKDKARKFKDTLMKHGHGHEHEGNLKADDEEVEDPKVHEAPISETTEDRRFAAEDAISGQRRGDVGNLPHKGEGQQTDGRKYEAGEAGTGRSTERDPHAPKGPGESHSPGNYESKVTDRTDSGGAEADVDPIVGDFKAVNVSDEPNYGPKGSQDQFSSDKSADKSPIKRENLESIPSQEHQPTTYAGKITSAASSAHGESHSPGNYESKVTDPTDSGGAEADVDPKVGDFKAVNVSDEPNYGSTGSQDQFSPDKSADKSPIKPENLESIPSQEHQPTTYAGKITSAAAALDGTAVSAKDAVASKNGYGSKNETDESGEGGDQRSSTAGENYGQKKRETVAPTGGAEADVDPIVGDFKASDEPNYGPTGSQDQFSPGKSADKSPIKRENLESIPSQEHQPTTYAGKITSAASALGGTAVSAKDAVASKLGYGSKNEANESGEGGDQKSSTAGENYGQKMRETVAPTGGAEADVDPIVGDFKAVNVSDEPNCGPTGSQDQLPPDKSADKSPIKRENLESIPSQEHQPTTYAGKITSAASALGGTAVSAKDAVASKLGYGSKNEANESGEGGDQKSTAGENYGQKIRETVAPTGGAEADVDPIVGDFKAVNVSDEPNYGPTGSQDQFSPDKSAAPIKRENLESIPSQEHQPTTYAGKITSAASALGGTAVSAKDAVASKLGYGSKNETDESGEGGDQKSSTAGENYGQKVRETVAPVYEKVAEAGSAEATKIQKTTTRGSGGRGEEVSVEEREGGVKRSSKGVPEEVESSTVKGQSSPGSGKGVVGLIRGAVTTLFGKGGDSHVSEESAGQKTAEAEVGKEN